MKKTIAKLLAECPGAEPEYFEASDWLDDETKATRKKIIKEYETHYERRLQALIKLLGEPSQTDETHAKAIARWFPEAIRAACWNKDEKTLCLALEQQDSETPVAVVLRCLTDEEIEELSS